MGVAQSGPWAAMATLKVKAMEQRLQGSEGKLFPAKKCTLATLLIEGRIEIFSDKLGQKLFASHAPFSGN